MPSFWTEKFTSAILAASQENQDHEKAVREWRFTGSVTDHGSPTAICGICSSHGLRYHFKIINLITGETLWVGSQCILNFEINPAHQTQNIILKRAKIKVKIAIDAPEIANLILPLKRLYDLVGNGDRRKIHWAVGKFQRIGEFSPKDLAWLFRAMSIVGIQYDPQHYPLTLRTKQHRVELSQLSITARKLIEPCLRDMHRINH